MRRGAVLAVLTIFSVSTIFTGRAILAILTVFSILAIDTLGANSGVLVADPPVAVASDVRRQAVLAIRARSTRLALFALLSWLSFFTLLAGFALRPCARHCHTHDHNQRHDHANKFYPFWPLHDSILLCIANMLFLIIARIFSIVKTFSKKGDLNRDLLFAIIPLLASVPWAALPPARDSPTAFGASCKTIPAPPRSHPRQPRSALPWHIL